MNGAVTRTYAYGLQRISENQLIGSTWTPSFYGYDGHGNVRFLTNTAGAITDTYTYDAFGMPIASTGTTANNFLYSGEQFDSAAGLYYLRARYLQLGHRAVRDHGPRTATRIVLQTQRMFSSGQECVHVRRRRSDRQD